MAFTADDAELIATKLGATIDGKRKSHAIAKIRVGNELMSYGIRRDRSKGHDYIANQIRVPMAKAKLIAACTWYRKEWVAELIKREIVPPGTT